MTGPRIPARRFFVGRAVESGMNHDVAVMYVVAIEDEAVAAERERLRAALIEGNPLLDRSEKERR